MAKENLVKRVDQRPLKDAILFKNKFRFLGLTLDDIIKVFFAGNAWIAIVVLALITYSLFNEGWRFFPQNLDNLKIYRQAGLEYVDIARDQLEAHSKLTKFLDNARAQEIVRLTKEGKTEEQIQQIIAPFSAFITAFGDANIPLDEIVNEMAGIASDLKDRNSIAIDMATTRQTYLDAGMTKEAADVQVENVDFAAGIKTLRDTFPRYVEVNKTFANNLNAVLAAAPVLPEAALNDAIAKVKKTTEKYIESFPLVEKKMQDWNPETPVPAYYALTTYLFGTKWTTQSFWQDSYGLVPLFVGSLCISLVAMAVSVPFGVCSAIYVNQLARPKEQAFIKPYIEFISAIPSVVLGFFGIAVFGESMRWLSQQDWLAWVPFFPFSERLNIATAGLLLGLMATPTIFTLTEDALNNVPRYFKEASFALGATRLQTIIRILVPASLSGIISAVLLGLGRVMGETMVVLLCAGNRIAIPDFSQGLGFIFQPVHTMVGLVAQEIPEVVKGSLQYRALFMLAITLFFIALFLNYTAQLVVKKYKISIG